MSTKWSRRGMCTKENVRRFTEHGPGATRDRDVDADSDQDEVSHNALLGMGERRFPTTMDDGHELPGEERAGPSHLLQVPEQRPNTPLGSSGDEEDFPPMNVLRGTETLATTMVILRRENDGPEKRPS